MCFVLIANGGWAFSAAADQTVRVKVRRDLLLGHSCIDAICHHRLTPSSIRVSRTVFFFWHSYLLPLLHSLLSPATYHNPPYFLLHPFPYSPQTHVHNANLLNALLQEHWCNAELKRWQAGGVGGLGWERGRNRGGRGSERKRLRDWNGYSGWNLGIKWTVGGECKTENKREALIAGSPERNREIGVDYSKEMDKAPLTAASSCFPGLCHHTTPPWCLFVFLIIYSTNCGVSAV